MDIEKRQKLREILERHGWIMGNEDIEMLLKIFAEFKE